MITIIVTKYLLQDSPVFESHVDSLLSTSQSPLYLHHLPRIGYTHWTLNIIRGFSYLSIIRLNSLTRTKKLINKSRKIVISLYFLAGNGSFTQTITAEVILSPISYRSTDSLFLWEKIFIPHRRYESLFHRQILDNRFLYHPSTYFRIESEKE